VTAGGVQVSLLFFDGCPHSRVADERLREALTQIGQPDTRIEYRTVTTPEQAEELRFRGSPTVFVDGATRSSTGTPRWVCPAGCTAPMTAWPARRPSSSSSRCCVRCRRPETTPRPAQGQPAVQPAQQRADHRPGLPAVPDHQRPRRP
jgi:hypothetical protein